MIWLKINKPAYEIYKGQSVRSEQIGAVLMQHCEMQKFDFHWGNMLDVRV